MCLSFMGCDWCEDPGRSWKFPQAQERWDASSASRSKMSHRIITQQFFFFALFRFSRRFTAAKLAPHHTMGTRWDQVMMPDPVLQGHLKIYRLLVVTRGFPRPEFGMIGLVQHVFTLNIGEVKTETLRTSHGFPSYDRSVDDLCTHQHQRCRHCASHTSPKAGTKHSVPGTFFLASWTPWEVLPLQLTPAKTVGSWMVYPPVWLLYMSHPSKIVNFPHQICEKNIRGYPTTLVWLNDHVSTTWHKVILGNFPLLRISGGDPCEIVLIHQTPLCDTTSCFLNHGNPARLMVIYYIYNPNPHHSCVSTSFGSSKAI